MSTDREIRKICQENKEQNKTRRKHEKLPTTPNAVRRALNVTSPKEGQQLPRIFSGKDKDGNSSGV